MFEIRPAEQEDADAIWKILEPIIRDGKVFAFPRDMSREAGLETWAGGGNHCYCLTEGEHLLGVAYLRENPARRSELCANAGYAVAANAQGKGVARALCLYTLDRAVALGYQTMQFNYVVSTNERAVRLWQSIGFEVKEVLPKEFDHPKLGAVDVFVMAKSLP